MANWPNDRAYFMVRAGFKGHLAGIEKTRFAKTSAHDVHSIIDRYCWVLWGRPHVGAAYFASGG